MKIARPRPHVEISRRHGFQIVVEHIGFCRDDDFERAVLAKEVGRQNLDGGIRASRADGSDGLRKMFGAAIGEVVTVDVLPEGSPAGNPAFDVTPGRLVTGLITERGVCAASEAGLLSLYPEQAKAA